MAWLKTTSGSHMYSSGWFHGIRFFQFVASGTVAGLMFFFIHHLRATSITIPWMFFLLQAAALTTILWLVISSLLQCWHRLSPLINAIVNGFTGFLWIGAFSLLAWRMGNLTVRSCSMELWGSDKGVLVCQLYKLLFGAACVGIFANICAFILDIRALRSKKMSGPYGRALADQHSKEPLRHKDVPRAFGTEETQYLYPESTERLYDPRASTPSVPLRSVSPAPISDHGRGSETHLTSRRTRSVSPGVSKWKEVE